MKKNFMKISTITFLIVVALFVAGLPSAAKKPKHVTPVKNVILLIGDGMGPAHVELTRLCLEVSELAMEEMDENPSYMTTYCLDREDQITHKITDSAAAGYSDSYGMQNLLWRCIGGF